MKVQKLFDIPVNTGAYNYFIQQIMQLSSGDRGSYVCVMNVHMIIEARRKDYFKKVIEGADMITPDGKPLTWALKILYNIDQDRVAGMDILPDLLVELEKHGLPVFFYGGTQDMLDKTASYITKNHPALVTGGLYSPPFRALSEAESQEVADKINNTGSKVIFVVLGCPKQEIWMYAMKEKINGVMIGIGGALPVVIGSKKRAPKWMQTAGLEWLFRLIQEPVRLFKRYALTNSWFVFLLTKEFFKTKFQSLLKFNTTPR